MYKKLKVPFARARALFEFGWYADIISRLTFYECDKIPTLAIDPHGRVYVNKEFWDKSTLKEKVGYIVHESQHVLRRHHERAQAIDAEPQMANICQDAEINDCKKLREFLPDWAVYPEQFGWRAGKPWEEYYTKNQEEGSASTQPKKGEGKVGAGDCGSGASGKPQDYELPAPSEGGPGMDEVEKEIIIRKVAEKVTEQAGRDPGSVGGSARVWAQETLAPPKVPWQKKLRGSVRNFKKYRKGLSVPTYSRANRKNWNPRKLLRPGFIDPIPNIAVLVDTSGSMYRDGPAILAEVQGCLKAGGGSGGTVLVCDARMQGIKKVKRVSQMDFNGGGGTDMRIGIKAATELKDRPDYLVILTDGYTPWPETKPPHMRIVVGLVGVSTAVRTPEWVSETIYIPTT
jgi:predicted metal-dependent peptidase